jgi:glycosyltransferase involved in cell wall biosynthesis
MIILAMWARHHTYGGLQSSANDLCDALGREGIAIRRYETPSPESGGGDTATTAAAPQVRRLSDELNDLLSSEPIDVIHAHNLHLDLDQFELVGEVARRRGVPVVNTVHDVPSPSPALEARVQRLVRRRPVVPVVATSCYNERRFVSIARYRPLAVIPPGLDFDRFSDTVEPETRTIAYPGRLRPDKGALEAIRLVGELAAESGSLRLLLSDRTRGAFGESPEYFDELDRARAEYPGLDCEFCSGGRAVNDIYGRSVLTLTMPRSIEGFGLVPLESLASGRPVVAVPTGGMEWVNGQPGCIALSSRATGPVKQAIAEVMEQRERFSTVIRASRRALERRFHVRTCAKRYLTIYRRLRRAVHPEHRVWIA